MISSNFFPTSFLFLSQEYGECSCINPVYLTTNLSEKNSSRGNYADSSGKDFNYSGIPIAAVAGACDRDCKHFIPFLCGIVLLLLLNFINAVPNKMVVMRYVYRHILFMDNINKF